MRRRLRDLNSQVYNVRYPSTRGELKEDAMDLKSSWTRREWMAAMGAATLMPRKVAGATLSERMRGVFKTHVTRAGDFTFSPVAIAEIDYNLEPLKRYLTA